MASGLREKLRGTTGIVRVMPSADFPLKTYAGVVSSSDSVVMDRASRIYDLPGHVLADSFDAHPPDLYSLTMESR